MKLNFKNHTVCIYHISRWDLLNIRSYVGETENIIQDSCLIELCFEAQFNHTVFYLPYLNLHCY